MKKIATPAITFRMERRILLLLDCMALMVSFLCAIFLRYYNDRFDASQPSQYAQLFLIEALLYLLIYFRRRTNHTLSRVAEMDPFENLIRVIRNQVSLFILLILYLFATWSSARVSRLVIGYLFLLNCVLDYIVRMLYRGYLKRRSSEQSVAAYLQLVTTTSQVERVRQQLNASMPATCALQSILLYDTQATEVLLANTSYTSVLLVLPGVSDDEILRLTDKYHDEGVTVYQSLSLLSDSISPDLLQGFAGYGVIRLNSLTKKCSIMGVDFTVSDPPTVIRCIKHHLRSLSGQYLCFSNVHTAVMAGDDSDYRAIQNGSAFTFMDGNPIARLAQRMGHPGAVRVAGPDFMSSMFRATSDGSARHFFYGSSEETLSKLKAHLQERYPGLIIAGMYAPPFRSLSAEEDAADTERINSSNADIIWVGLGAPKQEQWMAAHKGRIRGLMVGVGAGFDFHAGTVKRAPVWMQRIGLEWLYRLLQDPGRLFRRYFVTNARFLLYVLSGRWRQSIK